MAEQTLKNRRRKLKQNIYALQWNHFRSREYETENWKHQIECLQNLINEIDVFKRLEYLYRPENKSILKREINIAKRDLKDEIKRNLKDEIKRDLKTEIIYRENSNIQSPIMETAFTKFKADREKGRK